MQLLLALCWATFLLMTAGHAHADVGEWALKKSEDGIEVFTRPSENSAYKEFKAITEIAMPVASVMAVLQDTDACPRWLHRCVESRVITQISTVERTFYQVSKLPFPARSRDAIFHASVTMDNNGLVIVSMDTLPDELPPTDHVRIREAYGTYHLEPIADATTRVTWVQMVNPAGALPAWMVNQLLTDMPYKSLKNLRDLATEPPYRQARFTRDDHGAPTGLIY